MFLDSLDIFDAMSFLGLIILLLLFFTRKKRSWGENE